MNRKQWKLKRIEKDITLTEIANSMCCSLSLLSKYENGKIGMSQEKVWLYKQYIKQI